MSYSAFQRVLRGLVLLGLASVAACSLRPVAPESAGTSSTGPSIDPSSARLSPLTTHEQTARDYPGIHNAVAFHDGFISGSVPEGDAGFDSLRALGVRTIISVDGAVPEVHRAAARGMRYIHLPIGYNGFDEQRRVQLARAARDAIAAGPVYIHCHHGKHRSAAAAASIAANLGWAPPEQGLARMKVAGTSSAYKGLFACALASTPLNDSTLDAVPGEFPSVWRPSGFVQGMLEIDEVFDRLKAIEKSAWRTPADHPDLVPAAEAGRLADLYRALLESDDVRAKSPDLSARLRDAQRQAQMLEDQIVAARDDRALLSSTFARIAASCKDCHAEHRD